MTLSDRAWAHIPRFEGSSPHMYRDTVGLVTVGVGCVVANERVAGRLPFLVSGKPATASRNSQDYWAVRFCEVNGRPAEWYKGLTRGRLAEDAIRTLFDERVRLFTLQLVKAMPEVPSFPVSAQLALLDMAFNMGSYALTSRFPKLMAACKVKSWNAAREQCHRDGVQPARNEATAALFAEAAGVA